MDKKEKSLKLNFVMNAILTMSSIIVPFITFPYISRVLGPEGVGKVNLAVSFIAYFNMFAQLGIPTYGIKACAAVRDQKEELSKTVRELLVLNLLACFLSYVALFIVLTISARLSGERVLYIICGATVFLSAIGMEWLYQGLEEYSYITVRSVICKVVAVLAMFLLVHEEEDYRIYAGILTFATGASYVLNLINSRKYISWKAEGRLNLRRHLRPVFIFFALACTTTIYTNLDNVMLGFMKNDYEVGIYSTAVKIKNILVSLITSLGAVLLPRASYYVEQKKMEEFRRVTERAMQFVLLSAIPVTVYFMIFAREGISFIAGDAFGDSVLPMQVIMPTLLFIGITNIMGIEILVPTGREKKVLFSTIGGAGTDVVINALLIPKLGATGAAIGTVVAEFVVLCMQAFFLRKEAEEIFNCSHFLRNLLTVIPAGILATLIRKLNLSLFWTLCISAAVFFSVYTLENLKDIFGFIRGARR